MSKNPSDAKDMPEAIGGMVAYFAALFWEAWFLMLAFGVAHGTDRAIPAFGYWQSLFFAAVFVALVQVGVFHVDERLKRVAKLL